MMNRLFYIMLGAALLLCACQSDIAETPLPPVEQPVPDEPDEPSPAEEWGEEEEEPTSPAAVADHEKPHLLSGNVVYNDDDGKMSATFAFNLPVNITVSDGWIVDGNGTKTVIVKPDGNEGGQRLLSFTAVNSDNPAKQTSYAGQTVVVTSGVFNRPASPPTPAVYYTAQYADKYGAAGIILEGEDNTQWLYIRENDTHLRAVLRAASESGAYGLFHIAIADTKEGDSVQIRGTELPESATIINIGLPDDPATNNLLPEFSIPFQELGEPENEDTDYSGIRLRVNRNAGLVIRAGQPNNSYGYLTGACVEVAAGGKLRSEAPSGFPLGKNSVAIIRLNSYFAAGTGNDWIIGPAGADPVIAWDTGDQNGSFVEIREVDDEGRIAFDVNITVRKTLFLEYSLWFIGGPSLTINIPEGPNRGVFNTSGKSPEFYGSSSFAGGHNLVRPSARIILKHGNSLAKCLIEDGATDADILTANSSDITIRNNGKNGSNGDPVQFIPAYGNSYLNWEQVN